MKVVMKAVTIIVVSLLVVALLFIAGSQNAYAAGKCTEGNFRCSAEYPTTVKPVKPSDARQDDSDLCLNERGVAFYGISTVNGRTISGIFTNSKDGNANTPANFVFCAAGDYPSRVRNSDGTYRDGNENSRGGYRCCPTGTSAIDDGGILCCPPGTVRTNGDNGRARPSWTNDDGGSWDRQLDSASDGDDFCFNRAGETLYITIADGEYSGIGDYNLLEKYDYRAEFNFNLHAGRVSQTSDPAFGVAELRCSDEYACQISEEGSPVSVGSICSDDDGEYCFEEGDELGEGDDRKICNAGSFVDPTDYVNPTGVIKGCESIEDSTELEACRKCVTQNTDPSVDTEQVVGFVWTGLGCVDTSRDGLITRIFQTGVGVIGGIMIVMFIMAAFKMQTDNPEQIREAKEMITSAIIALFILIGAVVILRFLGINVLGILPGSFLG